MTDSWQRRLFGFVMFWTVFTTVFAWLPLARIIGRAEGYTWGIAGVSGEGFSGPFWIFILLTVYAVTLLWSVQRGPRSFSHPMLIVWHLAVTAVLALVVIQGGEGATVQGQGLHWIIPAWAPLVLAVLFTAAVTVWVWQDARRAAPPPPKWGRKNTRLVLVSLLLLAVSLVLFRLGDNYNWITAAAIIVAVAHWIVLVKSFEPEGGASATG